jgi:hypothetical protein
MKVVINDCYGGFGLSNKALDMLGLISDSIFDRDRANPKLVEVVEKLGEEANGFCASLRVIEIPDDVKEWYIDDYDGVETIHEKHRYWG